MSSAGIVPLAVSASLIAVVIRGGWQECAFEHPSAVTKHRTPWQVQGGGVPFDDDVWELDDGVHDWTQAHDLAA